MEKEWHCVDLCLTPEKGDLQALNLSGFLRDFRRIARDYGLIVETVGAQCPAFHVGSKDWEAFERMWESTRPRTSGNFDEPQG